MLVRTGEEGQRGCLLATLKLAPLSSTASSPLDRKWQRIMPHSPAASPHQPSPPYRQTQTVPCPGWPCTPSDTSFPYHNLLSHLLVMALAYRAIPFIRRSLSMKTSPQSPVCRTVHITMWLVTAAVRVLSVPKGPCAKSLVPNMVLGRGSRTCKRKSLGRGLSLSGGMPSGAWGTLTSFCISWLVM